MDSTRSALTSLRDGLAKLRDPLGAPIIVAVAVVATFTLHHHHLA